MAGRPKLWPDKMAAAFPAGIFRRAAAVLHEGEDRTDLVRDAVERELKRREKVAETTIKPRSSTTRTSLRPNAGP